MGIEGRIIPNTQSGAYFYKAYGTTRNGTIINAHGLFTYNHDDNSKSNKKYPQLAQIINAIEPMHFEKSNKIIKPKVAINKHGMTIYHDGIETSISYTTGDKISKDNKDNQDITKPSFLDNIIKKYLPDNCKLEIDKNIGIGIGKEKPK